MITLLSKVKGKIKKLNRQRWFFNMNINNNIQLHPLEPGKRERAFWSSNGPPHNFLMMMSGMCWSNGMWRTMVSGLNAQSIRIHIKVTTRTWFGCVFILRW